MPNPTGKGGFKKGDDPNRHALTTEERRRGYYSAKKQRGQKFVTWLRGRVALTARPATVSAYKQRWLAERAA